MLVPVGVAGQELLFPFETISNFAVVEIKLALMVPTRVARLGLALASTLMAPSVVAVGAVPTATFVWNCTVLL